MTEHLYNPETEWIEALEAAAVEATRLRRKLRGLDGEDRQIVERQLAETEDHMAALRRRLAR